MPTWQTRSAQEKLFVDFDGGTVPATGPTRTSQPVPAPIVACYGKSVRRGAGIGVQRRPLPSDFCHKIAPERSPRR